jgi:zinc D-Ala-D-Ala carboxypeptidase
MQLSTHLSLAEVTYSETAKRAGVSNEPTAPHLEAMKKLAEHIFEPIRNHFAKPIKVSSGYRSAALNALTPGSSATSQHCKGEALDLDQDGMPTGITNKMVFDYIKGNLNFDQLIWEYGTDANPDWVHVSYSASGTQRKQVLRCKRNAAGQPTYTNF